jgi:hypothetical protein
LRRRACQRPRRHPGQQRWLLRQSRLVGHARRRVAQRLQCKCRLRRKDDQTSRACDARAWMGSSYSNRRRTIVTANGEPARIQRHTCGAPQSGRLARPRPKRGRRHLKHRFTRLYPRERGRRFSNRRFGATWLGRIFERKSKPERAGTLSRMTLGASDDLKRLPPPSPILRVLTLTTSAVQ